MHLISKNTDMHAAHIKKKLLKISAFNRLVLIQACVETDLH